MVPRPLRIGVFALACAVVGWLSLVPTTTIPGLFTLWDKIEHAAAYLGLTLLGLYAFPQRMARLAIGLVLGGIGVEILQTTMALGRQGDPADALANTLGIATGLLLALAIRERIKVKSPAGGE
jgi:VanZ family protein